MIRLFIFLTQIPDLIIKFQKTKCLNIHQISYLLFFDLIKKFQKTKCLIIHQISYLLLLNFFSVLYNHKLKQFDRNCKTHTKLTCWLPMIEESNRQISKFRIFAVEFTKQSLNRN